MFSLADVRNGVANSDLSKDESTRNMVYAHWEPGSSTPTLHDINWHSLVELLDWQALQVGTAAVPLKLNRNALFLDASTKMNISLVLRVFDSVNVEVLKNLIARGHKFKSSPLGMMYFLEDCCNIRRELLSSTGLLRFTTAADVRLTHLYQILAKWVNIMQVLAEVWGSDPKKAQVQSLHKFKARELVFTFLAPETLFAMNLAVDGLHGTLERMTVFFGNLEFAMSVATTGTRLSML